MKKFLVFSLVTIMFVTNIYAQGQKETSSTQVNVETRIFVDSLGREVELPSTIDRVAPSGNLSQQIIYSIVPDKMVGWGTRPTDEMAKYFDPEVLNKPVYGAFYGKKANLNMEALLVADPQVVVDIGEIKGSKEEMIKDLDDLQAKLNIPVVFVASYLDDMGETYRNLGELLNEEEKAEERALYCDDTISLTKDILSTINEDDKVSIYYGLTPDGLTSFAKGNFHTQVFPLVGINNVVEGNGNWIKVSPEQIIIWDPDYIILSDREAYDSFLNSDSPYMDVTAIKNNNIYMIPEGPFDWIDSPPAMNRILGLKWLGKLIYPNKYDINIYDEAKTFYSLFYNYELSDEELEKLLENALN
ncbi:MAG: ABC transporter substrate-binding protein [Pleomorphochaeta sp.]